MGYSVVPEISTPMIRMYKVYRSQEDYDRQNGTHTAEAVQRSMQEIQYQQQQQVYNTPVAPTPDNPYGIPAGYVMDSNGNYIRIENLVRPVYIQQPAQMNPRYGAAAPMTPGQVMNPAFYQQQVAIAKERYAREVANQHQEHNGYSNPFCNVGSVPKGNLGNIQQGNPMLPPGCNYSPDTASVARGGMTPRELMEQERKKIGDPPKRDYYNWKFQNGIHPRSSEEEDYYTDIYYNHEYPRMVEEYNRKLELFNQKCANPWTWHVSNNPAPRFKEYNGYCSDMVNWEYAEEMMDIIKKRNERVRKQQEEQYKQEMLVSKWICKMLLRRAGYDQEFIDWYLIRYDDPDYFKKREEEEERYWREHPVKVRVVRKDSEGNILEVVNEGNWPLDESKPAKCIIKEGYDERFDYGRINPKNLRPVQWTYVIPDQKYFDEQVEKYGHMNAVEWFNGPFGLLLWEANERRRRQKFKRAQMFSFDPEAFEDLIDKFKDPDNPYDDGLRSMINEIVLGSDGEVVLTDKDGFHYDHKTRTFTITAPKNFDEYTPDNMNKRRRKQLERRLGFYNMVMRKEPDLIELQTQIYREAEQAALNRGW